MSRRLWTRGIQWLGYGLAGSLALVLLVVLLATQTAYGTERLRQVILGIANQQLQGSLHVGALRFGPGCAIAIDSVVLRDPDDAVLAQLGTTRATCRFDALVRGRLVVTSLDVSRPRVVLQQSSGGEWNWSRAARPDTSPAVQDSVAETTTSPARLVIDGSVRIHDGNLILEVPGMPRRVVDAFSLNAPRVRTELGEPAFVVDIEDLSGTLSEPPISLRRLSGSVSMVRDSADVDVPYLGFGQSNTGIRGWIQWSRPGTPALSVRLSADTLAFGDLVWLAPEIPRDGGGRFDVTVSSSGGSAPVEIAVRSVDLRSMRSHVIGSFAFRLDSARRPVIAEAQLEVEPLHTDLLKHVAGDAIPPALRGALHASIVARGNPDGRIRIERLDARYADEGDAGRVSRVTAHGDVMLDDGVSAASLEVIAHAIHARTIARIDPSMPLRGILSGTMTVNATPTVLRIVRADLRYAEGDSSIRLTGGGRIGLGTPVDVNLKFDAHPLAPSVLAGSFPQLAGLPSFEGPVEIRGSPSDLSLTAGLRSDAGSIGFAGRYRTTRQGIAVSGTARLRDVDPRAMSGRSTVPAGKLDADLVVDLAGDSLPVLRGKVEASQVAGTLSGVAIEPSLARISLTESRIVAESVSIATSAGSVLVTGALARHGTSRDTMTVVASTLLEHLRPLLQNIAAGDSATPDSIRTALDSASGTINATVHLTGSIDSLVMDAQAEGTRLNIASIRASRLGASASLSGLPGPPRGRVALVADSIATQGARFSAFTASAVSADSTWLVKLATSPDDRPGVEASGSVLVRADTVSIALDSLLVRGPGGDLRMSRPARIRFDSSGTLVVDTVELRGTRGGVLQLAGVVRDTGAIAVSLHVDNVPVHVAGIGEGSDSLRTRVDLRGDISGTAREPRATLRTRVRLTDADSIALDSIIGEVAHERGTTRLLVNGFDENRSIFLVRATAPVELSLSPFRAEVPDDSISGDVAIDSLFVPSVTRIIPGIHATAGVLRMKLALAGTSRHPRATGTTELRGVAARIAALGIDVRDANATLELSHERLTIDASMSGGDKPVGRAQVSGFVGLDDARHTDLRVRSSYMPVMRLADLADLDVSSDLRLVGAASRPTLSGTITVDRGVIRMPAMGSAGIVGVDDTAFTRLVDSLAPVRASRSPPGTSSVLERLEVGRIVVSMGPNVWLRSSDANIQIGGSIGLERANTAPGAAVPGLALRGALTTHRGNYRFSVGHISRLFELELGSVTFTGEPELNPRLDIIALYEREGRDFSQGSASSPRVRLHVGGTLEKPTLSFSSADAKLSQAELMSYLITGQTHFALGDMKEGAVSSELVASATDAMAQRAAGGVFDVVSVTAGSTKSAGSESRGAAANVFATSRLGVGKQVSPRLFLKVDAGLCALAGGNGTNELWQSFGVSLDYRFNRGLLGSLSSAPSTNGASCSNQAGSRGTALAPRQWGFDFNRTWRF